MVGLAVANWVDEYPEIMPRIFRTLRNSHIHVWWLRLSAFGTHRVAYTIEHHPVPSWAPYLDLLLEVHLITLTHDATCVIPLIG